MSRTSKPITVTSREDAAKTANVALLRRLEGKVHMAGSREIPLKEPARWQTYISNAEIGASAVTDMRAGGWVPVTADDLACKVEESGFKLTTEGYLVRGQRETEMLWKMSREDYRLLMDAKTEANMRGIGSASKTRDHIANAAGNALGSEAGDFLHKMPGETLDVITRGEAG